MNDEVIKNIFKGATSAADLPIRTTLDSAKQRKEALSTRLMHTKDVLGSIRVSLRDAIQKSNQSSEESSKKVLENEILLLDQAIANQIQQMADDIKKLSGMIEALEFSLIQISNLDSKFESELRKAKEIQHLQQAGELEKKRKPGSHPKKLKDIRNYSDKLDSTEEPDDANNINKNS